MKLNMENQTRRTFIATAATVGAVGITPAAMALGEKGEEKKRLVHHVFFWLKNAGSEADRKKLIEGLNTLRAIEVIKDLRIGIPASTEKRDVVDNSFDVSELMYFDNTEDQATYQVHEIHKKFVAEYSHLWAKVIVYDMMEV